MKWRNVISAVLQRPWRSDCPARGQSCQQASAGECHTAPPMKPKSQPGGIVPLELLDRINALMIRRKVLATALRCKDVRQIDAELVRLRNQILSRGRCSDENRIKG